MQITIISIHPESSLFLQEPRHFVMLSRLAFSHILLIVFWKLLPNLSEFYDRCAYNTHFLTYYIQYSSLVSKMSDACYSICLQVQKAGITE